MLDIPHIWNFPPKLIALVILCLSVKLVMWEAVTLVQVALCTWKNINENELRT